MNLSQVEMIVEIAKAGSISQAAQNMFVSQPSVSKALQRFEEEVGAQIFERVSTGIRLTPIGRRFVDNARDIMEQVDKLNDLFTDKSATVTIELSIASVSYHFMQFVIAELYRNYSKSPIHIKYAECGFDTQLELIGKGEVEIGIAIFWRNDLKRALKRVNAKGVEYHRMGEASLFIGVSKNSKRYPKDIQGLELGRLSTMPLVTISTLSPLKAMGWEYMHRYFGHNQVEASNQEIVVNNTATMCELVESTDGFSLILLNKGLYERYGYYDNIRLIPVPGQNGQAEIGWLQQANTVRSPLADEFVSTLSDYASGD